MRFEEIRIRRFGRIRDLATGPESLPGLVSVAGPNEAGKSTFFRFLTSLLYGFHPANRDKNRDAPWNGEEADGWARVVTDDGELIEIRRRLQSAPWGRMVIGGREEDLRNGPLPQIDRLPRNVFRQVFALTLQEVAALEAEDWTEVQDRLVSAMGARDLVAPRVVAEKLDEEAGALWRPNRRGNQRVRILGEKIRELEGNRDKALARDRDIRQLVEETERGTKALQALEEERGRIQQMEERVGQLLPVQRQLARIDELRERAGEAAALEGIPSEPAERRATLKERSDALAVRGQELDALLQGLRENERRANNLSRDLFGTEWTVPARTAVRGISTGSLRERLRAYRDARDARRLGEASAGASAPPPQPDRRPGRILLAGASVLLMVGLVWGRAWMMLGGAAGVLAGLWLLRPSTPDPPRESTAHLGALRSVESRTKEQLDRILTDLPLTSENRADPTLELPVQLQRLQELERDLTNQIAMSMEVAPPPRVSPADREPEGQLSLLSALGGGDSADPGSEKADQGSEAPTRGSKTPVESVHEALVRLGSAVDAVRRELSRAETERGGLEARLALLGEGDPDRGVDVAVARFVARRTAEELARELEDSHPDLDVLMARIRKAVDAGEEWTGDPHALTKLQRRRVEVTQRIEALGRDLVRSRQTLARLEELPTADQVDGQVLDLRAERIELARRRDRMALMAHLVREADRRFREERQPRVLARAGEYLSRITDGRYREILTSDQDGREVFKLRGDGHPHPVSMRTGASTGTREQAYLALRLAAVEELDVGGERLPVFVDEVFVNWDADRRSRGLELLAGVAAARQVFVFTCHEEVAGELERLGAHTVPMEGGRLRTLEAI